MAKARTKTTKWESEGIFSQPTIISGVIAVIVIVGLFVLFNAFPGSQPAPPADEQTQDEQSGGQNSETEDSGQNQNENDRNNDGEASDLPAEYTVAEGDNLWKISEKHYGTGFGWTKIMAENKLTDPDELAIGQKLTIPKTELKPQTHTVQNGETLWDIAEKYYGTGFTWEIILDANQSEISQLPGGSLLITPGQQLTIP